MNNENNLNGIKHDDDNDMTFLKKKKLRILNLIEATEKTKINSNHIESNNSDLNSQSREESDEEIEKYKNLISGKINIKSVLSNFNNETFQNDSNKNSSHTKKHPSSSAINDKDNNTNKNSYSSNSISSSQKLLNLLPAPKKNLSDGLQFLKFCNKQKSQNFFEVGDKFKDLANPDSDIINQDRKNEFDMNRNIFSYGNTINNVNVNDQIDKNWELNYLRNLDKDKSQLEHDEPTKQQMNKNHIKALISDHKKAKSSTVENEAAYSKYNKISTRNKYGW